MADFCEECGPILVDLDGKRIDEQSKRVDNAKVQEF